MTYLQIDFDVLPPVCVSHPWIHFDGILAHLYLRKTMPNFRALPSKKPVELDIDLPLKKIDDMYKASVSFFNHNDFYVLTIYKKFYDKGTVKKKLRYKKIDKSRGHFKDFMITLPYTPTTKITFYADGNPDEIDELLSGLCGIGKKVSIGFGFITDYSIKEIPEDKSVVYNGKAMRPIPVRLLKYYTETAVLAYKPPYWSLENTEQCAVPGSVVDL